MGSETSQAQDPARVCL